MIAMNDVIEFGTRFNYRLKKSSIINVIDFFGGNHADRALQMLHTEGLQDVAIEVETRSGSKEWVVIDRGIADMHYYEPVSRLKAIL